MRSLEARLHLGLGISLTLVIATAWWLGHAALHRSTEAYVLSRLQHDAEALLGTLSQRDPGPLASAGAGPPPDELGPIYRQPFSGHYYEIIGAEGTRRLSRSLWDQRLAAEPLPAGRVTDSETLGPLDQRLLVRSAGYRLGDGVVTIAVAEDLNPLLVELQVFERLFAVLAIGGLVLMLLVQRLIVRRALRQLQPIYRDIEALERGTAERITEAVPLEILPLVRKFNALLAVYGQRLERSRNAAGNLAHALKTPLNLLLQQLERLGDARDPAQLEPQRQPEIEPQRQPGIELQRQRCLEQVQRVQALVERELKRARIAGGVRPGSAFDADADLPVLIELLERMHADKGVTIRCDTRVTAPLMVDREDMLELIGNLLENACKWAKSHVQCRLDRGAEGLLLSVDDDGQGCSEAELAAIGARGVRVDERMDGHGLGLSIVREILDLYHGRLTLGRSPSLGGFRASVELPLSPPADSAAIPAHAASAIASASAAKARSSAS
ncbi:MAG: ATP-binding protein [Gammaproteobacteria bacterium]|jgi:signal transduction histidine kinase|nr:ATP-binding protein [Gammaproteobacteria bacterium]